jgi:uncharacterized membrane protein
MHMVGQSAGKRMLGIDAARGVAMLFSCLAHYGWWIEPTHPGATHALTSVGMIATPTFLVLSATVTGWLCQAPTNDSQRTQLKLLNRGLFLLTLGHLLVSLAEAHRDGLVQALSGATIIDDIGLCMLCCALWFPTLRRAEARRPLVIYGIAGYALSWLLILIWHPPVGGWLMLHQALLGPDPLGVHIRFYSSPLLPYMCLFAVGLGSSNYIIDAAQEDRPNSRRVRLIALGCALMSCALLLRVLRWLAERYFSASEFLPLLSSTLTIGGKLPPSPAYVLFYCGAGLAISGLLFILASSRFTVARSVAELTAVVGRASLFVFILQYFVFWTAPDLLGIAPQSRHLLLIFFGGLAANWLAAWWWDRMGANRFLTLGLRPSRRGLRRDAIDASTRNC